MTTLRRVTVPSGPASLGTQHRVCLAETRQLGDVVLLRYALSSRFAEEVVRT